MSDWAKPGVQCVCIKDEWGSCTYGPFTVPKRVPMINEILTVKAVRRIQDRVYLDFEEIASVQQDGPLFATIFWDVVCFRPLIKRKTDIALFTPMLTDARKPVEA